VERAERVNGLTPEQREQVEALIDELLEKMLLEPRLAACKAKRIFAARFNKLKLSRTLSAGREH